MTELVHLTTERGVATITLDSPHNRNALSRQLVTELGAHLRTAIGDDAIRVVVLTATGPTFCSGGDLKERRDVPASHDGTSFADILSLIMTGPTPVLVRLNGPTRAGGLGLVAAADIAVAPRTATFAFSEVRIGVAPAMIAVPCTRRMTPRSISRYFLTGEAFDATAAQEAGLVSVVTDDIDRTCAELIAAFRLAAPGALRACKTLIDEARERDLPDALATMATESALLFSAPEAQEGMAAFADKRLPAWAQEA